MKNWDFSVIVGVLPQSCFVCPSPSLPEPSGSQLSLRAGVPEGSVQEIEKLLRNLWITNPNIVNLQTKMEVFLLHPFPILPDMADNITLVQFPSLI